MTIRKTMTIDAPPSAVFRALTDEKALTEWFPTQARLEKRMGGQLEFKFEKADGTIDHMVVGKILEIIPDRKLSFSWKNTSDPNFPDTVVTWTLDAVDSRTRVELTHTGFEKGSRWHELHDGGWSYFGNRLAEYCNTGCVASRVMYRELKEEGIKKTIVIDARPEVVFRALTDEQELAQWFPDHAVFEPRIGGRLKFSFYKDSESDGKHDRDFFPEGTVLEYVPGKKLSHTWVHKDIPDFPESVVTWTLEPVDGGRTRVVLTHTGLKGEWIGEHDKGWSYFTARLADHCKKASR